MTKWIVRNLALDDTSPLQCMFSPGIKYDAEKEEKQLQEARQRELQRIEETKQKAAEQGQRVI